MRQDLACDGVRSWGGIRALSNMPAKVAMIMTACNRLGPHEPSAPLLGYREIECAPRCGAKFRVVVISEERGHRALGAVERDDVLARFDIPPTITWWPEWKAAKHVSRDPQPFCWIPGDRTGQFPGGIGHSVVNIPADRMDQCVTLRGRSTVRDKGSVQRQSQRRKMRGQDRTSVRLKRKIGLQNIICRPAFRKYFVCLRSKVTLREMVKKRP